MRPVGSGGGQNYSQQPSKAGGPGKKGHIPPGLAKKDPNSLPDGNPWKKILLEKAEEEKKAQKESQ